MCANLPSPISAQGGKSRSPHTPMHCRGPMLGRRKPPSRWCRKSSERRHSAPPHVYARTAMTGALVLTLVLGGTANACDSVSRARARTETGCPPPQREDHGGAWSRGWPSSGGQSPSTGAHQRFLRVGSGSDSCQNCHAGGRTVESDASDTPRSADFEGRTGGRTVSQDPRFLARLTHGFKPFAHGQRAQRWAVQDSNLRATCV